MNDTTDTAIRPFEDEEAVARYAERPPRLVPGFHDLQRMTRLLLAERAPEYARILVVGAGGGLELREFAQAQPGWHLTGVDPAEPMLALAARTTAPYAERIALHHGYVDSAPEGPFDGASCLLTMHFVERAERLSTLRAIRTRLKAGAAFALAHHSIAAGEARAIWLSRYAAFAASNGVKPGDAQGAAAAIMARLPVLSPSEDEALLREAGFRDIDLFYAAFTFRGWIAYA